MRNNTVSVAVALLFAWQLSCSGPSRGTVGSPGTQAAASMTLRVALYPYVPRLEQFKQALEQSWQRPDVTLELVEWDCYSQDPPADLDVFVFDAIFFDYFRDQGYLSPLAADEIQGLDDFLDYAITAVGDGTTYHAIPQLGCASLLFYRDDDKALARAKSLDHVAGALGACTYTEEQPPPGVGLMIDMSGGTTNASYYIEAAEDLRHTYSPSPTLPRSGELDREVLANLETLLATTSIKNARYENEQNPYQRATWFGQGKGRATVGFTESMSAMGAARDRVDFRPLPMNGLPDVNLFYADLVGVNRQVTGAARRAAAIELANLLASRAYLVQSFGPGMGSKTPQYLMPVRPSIFEQLGAQFPIYQEMNEMVAAAEPHLFRLGAGSRPWLNAEKSAITQTIFDNAVCPASP